MKTNKIAVALLVGLGIILMVFLVSYMREDTSNLSTTVVGEEDCSDLGKGIADDKSKFDLADISSLEEQYLKDEAGKDINDDSKFNFADVVSLVQCNLCKWNWADCDGDDDDDDDDDDGDNTPGPDDGDVKASKYYTIVMAKDSKGKANIKGTAGVVYTTPHAMNIGVTDSAAISGIGKYAANSKEYKKMKPKEKTAYRKTGIQIQGKVIRGSANNGIYTSFYLKPSTVKLGGSDSCNVTIYDLFMRLGEVGTKSFLPDGIWCPYVIVGTDITPKKESLVPIGASLINDSAGYFSNGEGYVDGGKGDGPAGDPGPGPGPGPGEGPAEGSDTDGDGTADSI